MWHFYFLRKNIWQTCLFLPTSIKICREKKRSVGDIFRQIRDSVSWDVYFVSTKNACCLPKLFSLRNTAKSVLVVEVEHVLFSECNADISAHLASCYLSKYSEVTEAKLIMARAEIQHLSRIQLERMTICPRHRHLLGRFWGGHVGKVTSVAGSHVITFQIADEIRLIFKEIAAVGSRKYQ